MAYVLVLTSNVTARPPAVIGGYKTFDGAISAGNLATEIIPNGTGTQDPPYTSFTVIPDGTESHCARSYYSVCSKEWSESGIEVIRKVFDSEKLTRAQTFTDPKNGKSR